jgi:hypothetical protein
LIGEYKKRDRRQKKRENIQVNEEREEDRKK